MSNHWTESINPDAELILVLVRLRGPLGRTEEALMALDTGSAVTILRTDIAADLDLTADRATDRSRLSSPTGPQEGYVVPVPLAEIMDQPLRGLHVHCHDLDSELGVDGVIGLDVLRQGRLTVDLPKGVVEFDWQ